MTHFGTGKQNLSASCTRLPNLDPNPSKIKLFHAQTLISSLPRSQNVARSSLRILLRHSRALHTLQTMPQHDSGQGEQHGRSVGEVAEHEGVGDAAVLVEDDEVGDAVGTTGVGKLFHDVVSAVDASRVGKAKAHFLLRLRYELECETDERKTGRQEIRGRKRDREERRKGERGKRNETNFGELSEFGRRVAGGGDEDARIFDAGLTVLVINVR
jgi:hypothetical protein